MKRILLLVSIMTALVFSSCTKEVLYNDYVQLSQTSHTFDAVSEEELEVEVKTNEGAEWKVTPEEGSWAEFTTAANKIIIKAQKNETPDLRETHLTVTSGEASQTITLQQLPFEFSGRFVDFPITSVGGFSKNGLYAGYISQALNKQTGKFVYSCKVHNTATGEIRNLEVPVLRKGENFQGIKCISNDGKTILYEHSAAAKTMLQVDGKKTQVKNPNGFVDCQPWYFNGDASIMVGRGFSNDEERMTYPIVWKNGEPEILEIPEFLANGSPMPTNGVIARGCSDDGSVIYGSEWKLYGLIYWKNGKMVDMGAKYAEVLEETPRGKKVALIQSTSSNTNISPNGNFIAAYYNANGAGALSAAVYPVVINTETEEAVIYREYPQMMGMSAMNDGTIFVGGAMGSGVSSAIDYKTGELKPISQWAKERYGLSISDKRFIEHITPDESTIFGVQIIKGGVETFSPTWYIKR